MTKKNTWVAGIVGVIVLALAYSWSTGVFSGVGELGVQVSEGADLSRAKDAGGTEATEGGAEHGEETKARKLVGSEEAEDHDGGNSMLGAVTVHVVWHDGKPAENVAIWCAGVYPKKLPGGPRVLISNREGVVRWRDLPAGAVRLRSGREGRKKVAVKAGVDTEVRFVIPRGVDVEGVVTLENGAPVQGADIWLASQYTDWRGGRFVTRSAEDGSFAIRSVRKGASIGAIAAGYQRSKLVDLDTLDVTQSPVRVHLILEPGGGTLLVQVLDPERKPLEGARIAVGKMPRNHGYHPNMETAEVWTPLLAISDAAGRARLHGLLPGQQDLAVRADGYPVWQGTVQIEPHVPTQSRVVLARPVVVQGIVKDGEQKPVAGAILRAVPKTFDEVFLQSGQFDYKGVFGIPRSESDAQGHYRLDAIPPGTVHLYAIEGGRTSTSQARAHTSKTLQASAGSELRWDPVLSPGRTIRGLVTYRDGKPMKDFFVTAIEQGSGKRLVITTDKDGRFRFLNLAGVKHDISVQLWSPPPGAPPLFKKDVWPDQGEVRLVASYDAPIKLAPGSVSGQVRDDHGRFSEGVKLNLTLNSDRGWFRLNPKITGMKFRFEKVEPGRYRLSAKAGSTTVAVGDWFEVHTKEDVDVGTLITTPAGSLQVTLDRSQGTKSIEPTLSLWSKEKTHGHTASLGKAVDIRVANISVGTYTYRLYAKGLATQRGEVAIQAGHDATLKIRLIPAVRRQIVIRLPAGDQGKLQASIQDASGTLIWSLTSLDLSRYAGIYKRRIRLPLGSFSLVAQTSAGAKGSRQFVMKTLAADQPPIELELQ